MMNDRLTILVDALLAGDRKECFRLVRSWQDEGLPEIDIYESVLLPALAMIGGRWERNEVTITTEHIATEIIRQIIGHFAASCCEPPRREGTVMIGCVPNEYHDLAGMIVTNMLEAEGWRVHFYGQSVPHGDVVGHVAQTQPGVAILIMKMLQHLDSTIRLARDIRRVSPSTRVLVGGVDSEQIRMVLLPHVDGVVTTLRSTIEHVETHMAVPA